MWPFKKYPKNGDLRICFQYGKYSIERYYSPLSSWESLHYYPYSKEYGWYLTSNSNLVQLDTLEEARKEVSKIEPQYFSAETPDPQPYGPF